MEPNAVFTEALKAIKGPAKDDTQTTLATIERCLVADLVSARDALQAAYALGKFDGAIALANVGQKQIKSLVP